MSLEEVSSIHPMSVHSTNLFLVGFLTAALVARSGEPPANDDFENRLVLQTMAGAVTGTNRVSGVNLDATLQLGEPGILGNPGGRSVWFTWTAPQNVVVTVTTAGSDFD